MCAPLPPARRPRARAARTALPRPNRPAPPRAPLHRARACGLIHARRLQLKKYFTFEVQVLDDKNVRRRFRASNYQSTTRVKPFICTMPMRLDEGWNQIQFNLSDFTRRAYGTNYIETLRVQIHANCRIRRCAPLRCPDRPPAPPALRRACASDGVAFCAVRTAPPPRLRCAARVRLLTKLVSAPQDLLLGQVVLRRRAAARVQALPPSTKQMKRLLQVFPLRSFAACCHWCCAITSCSLSEGANRHGELGGWGSGGGGEDAECVALSWGQERCVP
jgi:hypothetical protein